MKVLGGAFPHGAPVVRFGAVSNVRGTNQMLLSLWR